MSAIARRIEDEAAVSAWRAVRFTIGLAVVFAGAVLLLAEGATAIAASPGMQAAAGGGLLAGAATALGALPVLLFRRPLSVRLQDSMLGFGAGVMLAASAFSLVLPAIDVGTAIVGGRLAAAVLVAVALVAGVAGMFAFERAIPHIHVDADAPNALGVRAVWLMVFAILIHNFPEGLAIGAAFSGTDAAKGWPVAFAIAVQDIPEGLVVALALRSVGRSARLAAAVGAATGLAEPAGALLSAAVVTSAPVLYPASLAAAAGAMLFVVSHEIIPGTHRRGHEAAATRGIAIGFAMMMVLDNAFS